MSRQDAPKPDLLNDTPEAEAISTKPAWAKAEALSDGPVDPVNLDKSATEKSAVVTAGPETVATAKPSVSIEKGASVDRINTDVDQAEAVAGNVETTERLSRDVGAGAAAAVRSKPVANPPRHSPEERLRRRAWLVSSGRLIGGLLLLGLLFLLLTSGQAWTTLLFGWVLLTILADEFGGWFGYIGALMGLLTIFGPNPSGDPIWQVLLPLVGCALLALLLVKHSGGWLVLPFAAAVFTLPIYAAAQYGELLDSNLITVANPDLFRSAMIAMLMGLGVSLVRQLIEWIVNWQARRIERRELLADEAVLR